MHCPPRPSARIRMHPPRPSARPPGNAAQAVTCPSPVQCHERGTCDSKTGQCNDPKSLTGTACDDDDETTEDDTCKVS